MEAMARSLVVVSTPVGATADLVGDAGVLVPAGRPRELADAVASLLRDRVLGVRLGSLGRERIETNFSTIAAGRRLSSLFDAMQPGPPCVPPEVRSTRVRSRERVRVPLGPVKWKS